MRRKQLIKDQTKLSNRVTYRKPMKPYKKDTKKDIKGERYECKVLTREEIEALYGTGK